MKDMMKKITLLVLCLLPALGSRAQAVIETPAQAQPTAFAIVIDNATYRAAQSSVVRYRDAVQQDGLATYIVRGDWRTPDEVKADIVRVYRQAPMLEGIVLVGDIPVAMIRNAQHLTTAFKMNEETFPFPQSSVPSDRFYDDLHLKFDFIRRDSVSPHLFYYKLAEDSPQILSPTFYSARIKYPEAWGGDKYRAIADFLDKAPASSSSNGRIGWTKWCRTTAVPTTPTASSPGWTKRRPTGRTSPWRSATARRSSTGTSAWTRP